MPPMENRGAQQCAMLDRVSDPLGVNGEVTCLDFFNRKVIIISQYGVS